MSIIKQFFVTFLEGAYTEISFDSFLESLNPFKESDKVQNVFDLVKIFISAGMSIASLVAVAFIIISGYQYITAAGNDEQTKKATKTLTWSILGLLAILLSYMIIQFIIGSLQITNPAED